MDSNKNELEELEKWKAMKEAKCEDIKNQLETIIAECTAEYENM